MWLKQHKSTMTRNGDHTTYKNGDDWGMICGIQHYQPFNMEMLHYQSYIGDTISIMGYNQLCLYMSVYIYIYIHMLSI